MKKVKIVYNPFLLTTVITVDGKKPNVNSSLDFSRQRVQEWAEKLPKILLDEYRDKNIEIEFTGTLDDFSDLKEILNANKAGVNFQGFVHHRTPDIAEVEKKVREVFEEIQKGPVPALKDKDIQKAFEDALNAEFEINVVATMSSGKSTLINALLGKYLMPVANQATTATIVNIIATPQDNYSGLAFDKNGKELHREKDLNIDIMREWNDDENISSIDIYGPIPCANSVGMRLILVDTPGPNNSCDANHKKLTYEMLQESEKSLVLFVMDASQLFISNADEFLVDICKTMKEGGKQSRDRFLFAVNKLDLFKPNNGEKIDKTLLDIKKYLDDKDIKNPNIFPASSQVACEIRTDDDDPVAIDTFTRRCRKGTEFHFDSYYDFNHLPISSRIRVDALTKGDNPIDEIELHSGIPSIEEAIRLYVSKYARTIKVRDLVDAFNKRLNELKTEAEIQERIQHNKEEKARLEQEISKIQTEIESGKSAKEYAVLIDKVDVSEDVKEEMDNLIGSFQKRIDDIVKKYNGETKMPKEQALRDVKKIQDEKKDIQTQLETRISKVFEKTFKRTFDKIMGIYRDRLSKLGFKSKDSNFQFNPLDFIGKDMPDVESLVKKSTQTVDEGGEETRSRTVQGAKKINWFWEPSTWFTTRYEEKTEYYKVHVPKNVDYVDMRKVVNEFFVPMQTDLIKLEVDVPDYLEKQANKLKSDLKKELKQVERLLEKKLTDIKHRMHTANQTAAHIAEQERQLEWMRGITERVNKLINY